MTEQSRSVQRRIAAQEGLPAPDFSEMTDKLREQIDKILTEPNVSGMDWNVGSSILASWKAGLPDQIYALIKEALPELAKEAGWIDPAKIEELLIQERAKTYGYTPLIYDHIIKFPETKEIPPEVEKYQE